MIMIQTRSLILLFFFLPSLLLANPKSLLVLDAANSAELPQHFRSTLEKISVSNVNLAGYDNLHMAGSGEFSELGLRKVIAKLKNPTPFTIIDLRQESHGFLNGNAISWYGEKNASNAGLANKTIDEKQEQLLNLLAQINNSKRSRVF